MKEHGESTKPSAKIKKTEKPDKKTGKISPDEETYKKYFEQANDAILIGRRDEFIDCNPKALEMFGCTLDQLLNGNHGWFSPPFQPDGRDSKKAGLEKFDAAFSGIPQYFEWLHCRYDGTVFDAEVSLTKIIDREKNLFLAVVRDISKRKKMETSLCTANKNLQDIIDFLPDATFVIDKDKKVIAWNQAIEEMTGMLKEAILGKGDYAYAVPFFGKPQPILVDLIQEDNPEARLQYDFVERKGNVIRTEGYVSSLHGGKGAYLMATASPLFDSEGNLAGAIESVRDITRTKEAEDALRRNEEKYRDIFENAIEGIFQTSQEGRFITVNPAMARIFGYESPEDLVGSITDVGRQIYSDPEDRIKITQLLKTQGVVRGFEVRSHKKDGTVAWLSINTRTVKDKAGSILYYEGTIEDISVQKQAEEELFRANRTLQDIIDFLPDATFVIDKDKRVIAWNRALEEMTAVTKDEILGKGDYAYAVPFYGERQPILIDLIQSKNDKLQARYDSIRRDGNKIFSEIYMPRLYGGKGAYAMVMASPLFDGDGNVVGAIESVRNITLLKEAEKKLRESEVGYRRLYNSIMDAFVSVDLDRRIKEFNDSFHKMLGYEREELIGTAATDITPERWHVMESEILEKQVLKRGYSDIYEKEYIRKDGKIIPVEMRIFLLRDERCQPESMWAIVRDITERKKVEQDLLKAKGELEERVVERTNELKKANERLTAWTKELERRNQVVNTLNQMGDFLQACKTMDESYTVLGQSLSSVFSNCSGALYIFSASRNLLDKVAFWGEHPPKEQMFSPDDCWAIRRVRPHVIRNTKGGLRCRHTESDQKPYMCSPMMAEGEVLGMLHLSINPGISESEEIFPESDQQLINNVSDQIGMAIANMRLHEKLRDLSIRDPLTELYNRRFMEEFLGKEMLRAERSGSTIGVIMCDLDHFKRFNDTFGHEAGDALLSEVGKLLNSTVRPSDVACRYGGEEFILILPETSLEVAVQRAEFLRQRVKQLHVEFNKQTLSAVSLSLGVASYPEHGLTAAAVIGLADAALYKAKRDGRDRVYVVSGEEANPS